MLGVHISGREVEFLPVNPLPLKDFKEVIYPDAPIWYAAAFSPTENKAIYWRRSIGEALVGLRNHLVAIWHLDSGDWPWSHEISTALALAMIALFLGMLQINRISFFVIVSWVLIWVAPFILVPDIYAYRRGLAASAPLLFIIATLIRSITVSSSLMGLLLAFIFAFARFPKEFEFITSSRIRTRLSTHCQTAFPVRALLKSELLKSRNILFIETPAIHSHDRSCKRDLVNTVEFKRRFKKVQEASTTEISLEKIIADLPDETVGLLDCQMDGRSEPQVAPICDGKNSNVKVLGYEPDEASNFTTRWALIVKSE